MQARYQLYAVPHPAGMAIYLRGGGGPPAYVMTHRKSRDLFRYLRPGRTLREARAFRPGRNAAQQKMAKSLAHVVRVADWVIAEELAA
ncbi:MAG: hypothetical protein Q4E12_06295 [Coriobacteriia bacterium]|nr:hypothetical protein [Coriobacteriia bacterium]